MHEYSTTILLSLVTGVSVIVFRSSKATVNPLVAAFVVTAYLLAGIRTPSILTLIESAFSVRPADISSWNLYVYFSYLS